MTVWRGVEREWRRKTKLKLLSRLPNRRVHDASKTEKIGVFYISWHRWFKNERRSDTFSGSCPLKKKAGGKRSLIIANLLDDACVFIANLTFFPRTLITNSQGAICSSSSFIIFWQGFFNIYMGFFLLRSSRVGVFSGEKVFAYFS